MTSCLPSLEQAEPGASSQSESSRTARVANQLTDRILTGDLKSIEILPSERDLATQMGVSRTVVREATKMLHYSGLVSIRHGAATLIKGATSEPVRRAFEHSLQGEADSLPKLYEVRCALETDIAFLAAQRRSEENLSKMHELCERMDVLVDEADPTEFWALDMAFHSELAHATQNSVFQVVLEAATQLLIPMRRQSVLVGRTNAVSQQEHWQLLECVQNGESEAARTLMRRHLRMYVDDENSKVPF